MDITVQKLNVGTRLRLGKYGVRNDTVAPVTWLKASDDSRFICEYAVDYLAFDAKEPASANADIRYHGNSEYITSNIYRFLNADDSVWYAPAHETDAPPSANRVHVFGDYEEHDGFLYHFEDYELHSLNGRVQLPSLIDIMGDRRLPIFRKKGIRARPSDNMVRYRNRGFNENSFVDYFIRDAVLDQYQRQLVSLIGRNSHVEHKYPYQLGGIRPIVCLKADTILEIDDDGVYVIKPYEVEAVETYSDEDLFYFLGLR